MFNRIGLTFVLCCLPSIHAAADKWGAGKWGAMVWGGEAALADTDQDGVADDIDNCSNAKNEDQADSDNDGVGDVCDAFPSDSSEQLDTDGDGVGNAADDDDDNDGISDAYDLNPLSNSSGPASWQVFQQLMETTQTIRGRN